MFSSKLSVHVFFNSDVRCVVKSSCVDLRCSSNICNEVCKLIISVLVVSFSRKARLSLFILQRMIWKPMALTSRQSF